MGLNLLIALCIGVLAYSLTLYFDTSMPPANIQTAPVDVGVTIDKPVPEFTFTTLEGKKHTVTDFKNKTIILNFWATWCAPCVVEFPTLLRGAAKHKDDVVLIALSSDLNEDAINKFLEKHKIKTGKNVFIAIDENSRITHDLFQTYKLPETLIIDKNQRLRHKFIGANWNEDDLELKIKEFNQP